MARQAITKARALSKLRERRDLVQPLLEQGAAHPKRKTWQRDTRVAIEQIFGTTSKHLREFQAIYFSPFYPKLNTPKQDYIRAFQRGLTQAAPLLDSLIAEVEEYWEDPAPTPTAPPTHSTIPFVDPSRIAALKAVEKPPFDLSRLIRMAEEIDSSFSRGCYHAVAALTRALIDHVPPIFGCKSFSEVASNYGGAKSFRDSMQHLSTSARRIGDAHLHTQVRSTESLPSATQVNFSNDLDVLLAEIVRVLTKPS